VRSVEEWGTVKTVIRGSHLRRIFALLLACLWITSASFAEHLSAKFPLCQPDHSPCCPLPVNNAPESCPACRAPIAAAEKEESKSEEVRFIPRTESVDHSRATVVLDVALRELTRGLCYHPTVFQLKDDLRV
jgi:hypothetical protein